MNDGPEKQARFVNRAPDRSKLIDPMFQEIPAPDGPKARGLYQLWRDLCPPGDLPSRNAFTFERIWEIGSMGYFFVIEPMDGGRDWRYRLVGARITWLFGEDTTNVPFSVHYFREEAEQCIALSNMVAETRTPVFLKARFVSGNFSGELETMSLPVYSPDASEIWLIGASYPTGEAARLAGRQGDD